MKRMNLQTSWLRLLIAACCGLGVVCAEVEAVLSEPERDPLVNFLDYSKDKSERAYELVERGLSTIPKPIRENMLDGGYSVVISPTMLTAVPTWQGGIPRGWDEDSNYDNLGGLFQPRLMRIVIPEEVQSRSNTNSYIPNERIELTIRHEFGHAYDHYQGYISRNDDFIAAYTADADKLRNADQQRFRYFLQPNYAGCAELFAELFAAAYTPNAEENERYNALLKAFPKTAKFVMKISPNRPQSAKKTVPLPSNPNDKAPEVKAPDSKVGQQSDEIQGISQRQKRLVGPAALNALTLHKQLSSLYEQRKYVEAEPVMRKYLTALEESGTAVDADAVRKAYLSYVDLLLRLHKVTEAQRAELRAQQLSMSPSPGKSEGFSQSSDFGKSGKTGVIGIRFAVEFGRQPYIDEIFPGSPAQKAGLRCNDVIIAIDSKQLPTDANTHEISALISGTPGTSVTLTIRRSGAGTFNVTMKRIAVDSMAVKKVRNR